MYLTLRNYSGSPDLVDALVEREADVKSLITGIDGFKSYYLVRSGDGDAVSVSVYEDQAGGEASSEAAASWIRENLPDLSVSPPQVTAGEAALAF
jgi:heme-degrading monooxygenase HmoA